MYYPASFAVDGILETNAIKGCSQTNWEANPWWRVDLGSRQNVSSVYILNRGDCCGARLRSFEIRVGTLVICLNSSLGWEWIYLKYISFGRTSYQPGVNVFLYKDYCLSVNIWITLCFHTCTRNQNRPHHLLKSRILHPVVINHMNKFVNLKELVCIFNE